MGFYGNISNVSRSSFQFDKIYSSRAEMDANAGNDEVYIGRYVLVNYNSESSIYETAYGKDVFTKPWYCFGNYSALSMYAGAVKNSLNDELSPVESTIITSSDVNNGDMICLSIGNHYYGNGKYNEKEEIWKAAINEEDNSLQWIKTTDTLYDVRYNRDYLDYKNTRGYDSTVWMKTALNGRYLYVMVAELNTIVPIFDIGADVPTIIPRPPHFDPNSTNMYYKIHTQPTWGFRVKSANSELTTPLIGADGNIMDSGETKLSSNTINYPSDESVIWSNVFYNNENEGALKYYNAQTKKWETSRPSKGVPAAVYYNKKGMQPGTIHYSTDEESIVSDEIKISPTGRSGNVYSNHTNVVAPGEDVQEISVMLPSIGDTIAKVWDIVYGDRKVNDSSTRNTDINWEDATTLIKRQGLRLVDGDTTLGYNKDKVNTLAGCINTAHDLMGMIIVPITINNDTNAQGYSNNRIYYDVKSQQFYRKHLTYDYTPFTENDYSYQIVTDLNQYNYVKGFYYIQNDDNSYSVATGDFDNDENYYVRVLEATVGYEEVELEDFNDNNNSTNIKYYYQQVNESSKLYLNDEKKLDYIADTEYLEEQTYYTLTAEKVESIEPEYKKNTFWYKEGSSYVLDTSATMTKPNVSDYYSLNTNKIISTAGNTYDAVYVPNEYYYYYPAFYTSDGSYTDEQGNQISYSRGQEIIGGGKYVLSTSASPEKWGATFTDENWSTTPSGYITNTSGGAYQNAPYTYYLLQPQAQSNNGLYEPQYSKVTLTEQTYIANKYYYKDSSNNFRKATGNFVQGTDYYDIIGYTLTDSSKIYTIDKSNSMYKMLDYNSNKRNIYTAEVKDGIIVKYTLATLESIKAAIQNYENGLINSIPTYYLIQNGAFSKNVSIYAKDNYHYLLTADDNLELKGSYILDTADKITQGREYYVLSNISQIDDDTFYKSYQYYEKNPNTNQMDISVNNPNASKYYKKNGIYIINDSAKIYNTGAEWNEYASAVPPYLTLGRRTERYEFIKLDDFARNLNTLNGMILKANQLLEPSDTLTRLSNNVSGAINQIEDIIASVGKLKTNLPLMVDDYGRITSANIDTVQTNSLVTKNPKAANEPETVYEERLRAGVTQDFFAQVNSVSDMENQWITLSSNGSLSTPTLAIHHNYQPVANTTSTLNKNTATENKDSLQLYTPIVDATGHTVGNNIETVTLPYGYQTVKIENSDAVTDAAAAVSENGISATSTYDTLSIATSNKWIKLDDSNSKISVGHKINTIATTNGTNITNNAFGGTISIPDFTYDEAGHITSIGTHTENIPNFSLTNATSGNVVNGISYTSGTLTESKINLSAMTLGDFTSSQEDTENQQFTKDSTVADLANALESALATIKTMSSRIETLESMLSYNEEDNTVNLVLTTEDEEEP